MTLLEELRAACPSLGASLAAPGDAVDGVAPAFVARPADTAELAATMATAAAHGLAVVARSAGTKLDWGRPPTRLDLVVDCSGMARVLEHAAGDLVLRAQAGTPLAVVQSLLAPVRQWLPIDEVVPGSSLGGVVATGLAGPSRHAHGAVRDLLIGATVVRADGTVARAGGKVVKNVAGYDLCKLFTGSFGTLAVLAELTFRLRPLPRSRRFVTAEVAEDDLGAALSALRRTRVAPSAVELVRTAPAGPIECTVLLEGRPGPVEARAETVADLLGTVRTTEVPPPGWGELPGALTVKATSELPALPGLVASVRRLALAGGLVPQVRAAAGLGIAYVGLPADTPVEAVGALLDGLRDRPQGSGGATVVRGPRAARAVLDLWGAVPGIDLMRRIKAQFDPDARLAPGRFVGGI